MPEDQVYDSFVSVIIPTFNRVALLRQAIQSVQHQTYRHFELLVIDDHSTDNTEDHVRACAARDDRIRYIRNHGLKGVSAARNCGIDQCRGEFIALLDSDDLWMPDHLANAVALFQREPSVSLYFGNRIQFDLVSGVEIGTYFPADWLLQKVPHTPVGNDCYLLEREFLELFFTSNPIPTSATVLRRDSIHSIRFDESLRVAEDRHLWIRLCLCEGAMVAFRNLVVTRMARHGGNLSGHDAETRLNLLMSHFYIFQKLIADGRVNEVQRNKVCRQCRLERNDLPYMLRHAGYFGSALRAALNNAGIVPQWVTAFEIAKTGVCWALSPMHRGSASAECVRETAANTLPMKRFCNAADGVGSCGERVAEKREPNGSYRE